jgi:cytochrome c5
MKKHWLHISLGAALLVAIPLASQTSQTSQKPKPNALQGPRGTKPAKDASSHQIDGDQVFQHNCARCHTMPEGFSPRIAGTVVMHMRVRAGLSAEDEKALLRFLNP